MGDPEPNPPTAGNPLQTILTAESAFIFMFPFVENEKFLSKTCLDPSDPNYIKMNTIVTYDRRPGENSPVVTPNNDTLYSQMILDLRDRSNSNCSSHRFL